MPKSKQLTAHQVHAIRQHRQEGDTITAIARAYSRSTRTIADLLAGRTYQHVPENILSRELPGQAQRDRDLQRERDRPIPKPAVLRPTIPETSSPRLYGSG